MSTCPKDSAAGGAGEITRLLRAWSQGDHAAFDRLWPIIYDELRRLARRRRRREYSREAPETTALVHEAYLRLVGDRAVELKSRAHFFAIAARVMRRVLIDAARARNAQKRDRGHWVAWNLDGLAAQPPVDPLEFDQALQQLAVLDERQAAIVELRFFGGLTEREAAQVLDISVPTLKREWVLARAWLFRALFQEGS